MTAPAQSPTEVAPAPQASLVEFFNRQKRSAFHFALQMTGNREDALDLMQEGFLRLHREWHKRDRTRDPAPWLFAVIRNLAIDLLRRRSSHGECELDPVSAASAHPGPDAMAIRNEVAARLWREIAALPLLQREAVILRDWHGLSYAQIAEVTGVSTAVVTARLHDARTALRKRMGKYL
jgi:RNA polymerase sigma-70 factor (ECF subfamily)